jgi:tetratricopeptide (TPR) repeat protein
VKDHEFLLYDDDRYITANTFVHNGITLESIAWAFTTGHASNWHPLTWLSHMLDVERFGLQPAGHLLTNVFFHLVNTVLLLIVLRRMSGAFWQSLFVAAVFALHPLHVESVAWAAERKDVLSGLFWMLTLWAYAFYVGQPSSRRLLVVLVVFALGLMAKPMLVTLPIVLLLLDLWPLKRFHLLDESTLSTKTPRRILTSLLPLVKEKIPLFALTAISSVITYAVQQQGGAMSTVEGIALPVRVANALVAYVSYLGKAFWPVQLAVFYPHYGEQIPLWQSIGALVVLALLTAGALLFIRRAPFLTTGWLWFLGTLVPVIGLVQVGAQSMADRYTYVPLIGIAIMVAWGAVELTARWRYRTIALTFAAAIALTGMTLLSYRQIGYWKNSLTLFEHALSVTKKNWLAHHNLGTALLRARQYEQARFHFTKTLELYPSIAHTHHNLANALVALGQPDSAIVHYREALRLEPNFEEAHVNLGILLAQQNKTDEAMQHYREAIRINPRYAPAHYNLALLLSAKGKLDDAFFHLTTVLSIEPGDAEARREFESIRLKLSKQSDER